MSRGRHDVSRNGPFRLGKRVTVPVQSAESLTTAWSQALPAVGCVCESKDTMGVHSSAGAGVAVESFFESSAKKPEMAGSLKPN